MSAHVLCCGCEIDATAFADLWEERDRLASKLDRLNRIYEGLRTDANDGEFALWSEDDLVKELHSIRASLPDREDAK